MPEWWGFSQVGLGPLWGLGTPPLQEKGNLDRRQGPSQKPADTMGTQEAKLGKAVVWHTLVAPAKGALRSQGSPYLAQPRPLSPCLPSWPPPPRSLPVKVRMLFTLTPILCQLLRVLGAPEETRNCWGTLSPGALFLLSLVVIKQTIPKSSASSGTMGYKGNPSGSQEGTGFSWPHRQRSLDNSEFTPNAMYTHHTDGSQAFACQPREDSQQPLRWTQTSQLRREGNEGPGFSAVTGPVKFHLIVLFWKLNEMGREMNR